MRRTQQPLSSELWWEASLSCPRGDNRAGENVERLRLLLFLGRSLTREVCVRADVLRLAAELANQGEPFALATVVRREVPSSARVGDAALVTRNGEFRGWVGGGCIHPTVVREALRALEELTPRLIALSPTPDADRRVGVVPALMTCHSGGSVDIYVEPVLPAPRLVVYGVSPVARSLARIAKASAFAVDAVDPGADRSTFPDADHLYTRIGPESLAARSGAWTCAVVATMGQGDEDAASAALGLEPGYLGIVASRKRFAQIRAVLAGRGVSDDLLDRMKNPAGLDIGAELPEEIALSILSEIVQTRRRNSHLLPAIDSGEDAARSTHADAAMDPICGMSVVVAFAKHVSEHEGHTYYFCGASCRERFERNPAHYTGAGTVRGHA